jgi:hypothetical protein
MTTTEFCDRPGLNPRKLTNWIMNGLLQAQLVDKPHGGFRRELGPEHVERVRILKALLAKRIPFSQLADRLSCSAARSMSSSTDAS